jgi:membrane-associated phospholipid phosphatase
MLTLLRIPFFIFLITFLNLSLTAQQSIEKKDCNLCIGGEHRNSPPYSINLKSEKPFIITSAILLTSGFLAQAANNEKTLSLDDINILDKNDLLSIDKSTINNNSTKASKYSDYIRSSITLLPIYFLSNHHTKEDIGPLVTMSLEVLTATYGITNIAKNIAKRPRPFAYNPDISLSKKMEVNTRRSFFSGHTSHTAAFTFFIAKVVTDYHPNAKKGFLAFVWSGAALIPAVTGYLRIKAGKHFPTDVIAGYFTGAIVGYVIPYLHLKKESNINLTPTFNGQNMGLNLNIPIGTGYYKKKHLAN